jgi:hypothetical protein
MSVTSKQILEATGLKSPKTLTRWAKSGVIPGPYVGTHPSGRGKIAYWPDWVLGRCKRIAELLRQGHTLASAISVLENERILRLIDEVENFPDLGEQLSKKKVKLPNGQETNLSSFIHAFIAQAADTLKVSESLRKEFFAHLHDADVAGWSLRFLEAGYNPVCLFDGERIEVIPDFRVAHRLGDEQSVASAWLVITILPSLRKAFSALGRALPKRPTVRPAPKVWVSDGDALVEYSVFLGGVLGFEVVREAASTIGITPKIEKQETNEDH